MNTTPEKLTIGLDLGDRRHHYCVLDAAGTIHAEASIPNTRECLAQLSASFPAATFIMETGTQLRATDAALDAFVGLPVGKSFFV